MPIFKEVNMTRLRQSGFELSMVSGIRDQDIKSMFASRRGMSEPFELVIKPAIALWKEKKISEEALEVILKITIGRFVESSLTETINNYVENSLEDAVKYYLTTALTRSKG